MCIFIALWDPVTRLKVAFQLLLLGTCSLLRSLHLYFLFACVWFERWRAVRGLSTKRSLHMSPIGGVWLGARPKLTELCLFLLLALILPPARGPGGRERAAGKQPAALQLIISPNLHLLQAVIRTLPLRPTANITQSYSVSSTVIPVSLPPSCSLRLAPREVLILSRPHPPTHSHRQRVCLWMPVASWYFAWHLPCFKGGEEKMNTLVTYKLQQHTNLHVNVMFWEIGDVILPCWCLKVLTHLIDSFLLLLQLHIRLTLTACL